MNFITLRRNVVIIYSGSQVWVLDRYSFSHSHCGFLSICNSVSGLVRVKVLLPLEFGNPWYRVLLRTKLSKLLDLLHYLFLVRIEIRRVVRGFTLETQRTLLLVLDHLCSTSPGVSEVVTQGTPGYVRWTLTTVDPQSRIQETKRTSGEKEGLQRGGTEVTWDVDGRGPAKIRIATRSARDEEDRPGRSERDDIGRNRHPVTVGRNCCRLL